VRLEVVSDDLVDLCNRFPITPVAVPQNQNVDEQRGDDHGNEVQRLQVEYETYSDHRTSWIEFPRMARRIAFMPTLWSEVSESARTAAQHRQHVLE
jgi:hypothetical protein